MLAQTTTELAAQFGLWLQQKNWRVATAESCTAGGIGYAISSIAGSSAWFEGGFITYSNALKHRLVQVTSGDLERYGAVSSEVAAAMAIGAMHNAQVDCAIAVTGIAGPAGGSPAKPVGLVWFGLAWAEQCITWSQVFPGNREAVRLATIEEALRGYKKILDTV